MTPLDDSGHGGGGTTDQVLRVREARTADHDAIGRLTVDAFRALAGSTLSDGYAAELADVASRSQDAVILVAEIDGQVVGSVAYIEDSTSALAGWLGPGEAGLRMLAVAPRAQGAGVGTRLVDACLQRARAEGRHAVALYSTELMRPAHRLYLRAGFVRASERDREVGPGLALLSFVKWLD